MSDGFGSSYRVVDALRSIRDGPLSQTACLSCRPAAHRWKLTEAIEPDARSVWRWHQIARTPVCYWQVIRGDFAISAICPPSGSSQACRFGVANIGIGVIQASGPGSRIKIVSSRTWGTSISRSSRVGRGACQGTRIDVIGRRPNAERCPGWRITCAILPHHCGT